MCIQITVKYISLNINVSQLNNRKKGREQQMNVLDKCYKF